MAKVQKASSPDPPRLDLAHSQAHKPPTSVRNDLTRQFDVARLRESLAAMGDPWGPASSYAESGVHHLYRTAQSRRSAQIDQIFSWILAEFAPVRSVHLGMLEPGGFIVPHQDAGPWFERWQVPIYAAGKWHGGFEPQDGIAFQVHQNKPHAVWNLTDDERVHLIIDRAIRISSERTPQVLFLKQIPVAYRATVRAASGS